MNEILPYSIRTIPFFNKLAVIPINFIAIVLLLTVFNHTRFKDSKSRIFLLMGVSMLLWVDFAYLARIYGLYADFSEILLRIAWVATPPVFLGTYLMSIYITGKQSQFKWVTRGFVIITILLSLASGFTDLILSGIKFTGVTLDIVYGTGLYVFLGLIFIFIVFTLVPLFRVKLNSSGKMLLTGIIVFYIANLIFNISLPIFFNITHLYYFGDYSTMFLLSFTTYAILKHELFDVKTFATELLTISIWGILFAKLFFFEDQPSLYIDIIIFVLTFVFGLFLIRSVRLEVMQKNELEKLTKELQELDERKNEFLNIAAHELRAPMTAIKGYLSMIMEGDAGQIPDQVKEFLNEAGISNDRLIRLVNNMLNTARIEENRQVYNMALVDISKVTQTVFNEFKQDATTKKLTYNLVDLLTSSSVYVDPDRIHEVIGNFISNAIKYTDHGSVQVMLKNPTSTTVRFDVVDTGPGIPAESQSRLFEKFYRVETENLQRAPGTGLGLYISKLLVEKFGGKIGFNSELGKGSNFWFELPITTEAPKIEPSVMV